MLNATQIYYKEMRNKEVNNFFTENETESETQAQKHILTLSCTISKWAEKYQEKL